MTPYCRDCRHVRAPRGLTWALCARAEVRDPVTGDLVLRHCSMERIGPPPACGPKGRKFEPTTTEFQPRPSVSDTPAA